MKKTVSEEKRQRMRFLATLRWRLTLFVFSILMISGIVTSTVYVIVLLLFGFHPLVIAVTVNPYTLMITLLIVCALIGTLLSGFLGRYYLRPLKQLTVATQRVKKGDFKVHIETKPSRLSEMDMLIDSFNEMTRELDGIELFRNDFINNFSHEFKTPIVSIRGFARELQREDIDDAQRKEYATIIAEEADRLTRLATGVLELSKLENQQIVTNKTEFYLDEQLRQIILSQEPIWSQKGIEVVPELEELSFYANEELLLHIWTNLLSNAFKFTGEGGTVQVTLKATDSEARVVISDNGVGMSEEVKSHIFEKFYQGDPSHHDRGYGIGLTMVARVVKLCRGKILVESTVGKGTAFTVVLPREKAPVEATLVS